MTDIGTQDDPLRFIGDELQIDVFDGSDPADTGTRRWWFRSDLSVNDSDAVIRVNNNGDLVDVPVYHESTSVEAGIDTRFGVVSPSLSEPAFVPLADPADAAFDFARMETPSGTELSLHNRTAPGSAIPDSVVYQYDAQKAFTSSDEGATTTSWSDSVGSADLSGGSPTVVGSGINGFRSVDYDGSDDELGVDVTNISQPLTIFTVVDSPGPGDEGRVYSHDSESDPRVILWYSGNNSEWRVYAGSTLSGSSDATSQLIGIRYDGNNSVIREDGTQTGSGGTGSNSLVSLNLGSEANSSFHSGLIGRVEVHDTGLTDSEMASREQEIANDWGITL